MYWQRPWTMLGRLVARLPTVKCETPLRLLVEDARSEYSIPWPYVFRSQVEGEGDFFAVKSGHALHDSIKVRGWTLWSEEAAHG